jgi:hypothetical protein
MKSAAPILTGAGGEGQWELVPGEQFVGRDPDVRISVDHPDVSRRHARVVFGGDCVHIEDLGSKNGIWVSGRRAAGEATVTRTRGPDSGAPAVGSLVWPLLAVVVFGALALALIL